MSAIKGPAGLANVVQGHSRPSDGVRGMSALLLIAEVGAAPRKRQEGRTRSESIEIWDGASRGLTNATSHGGSEPMKTALCDRLGIEVPIIQAPMGGAVGPALVAAVSNAGGLGMLVLWRADIETMKRQIRETRALTSRPF